MQRWFWTTKDVYWEAIIFFQIGGSWKSWCHRFFFFLWKILGSQLEKKKKRLLGGYKFYWNLCWMTHHQIFHATRNGGCIFCLNYNNTAALRRCHTIFDYQIRGSQKYCRGTLENFWIPYSKENGDLMIHLFMFFETMISLKFNLAISILFFSHLLLLLWCIVKMNSLELTVSRVWKIK